MPDNENNFIDKFIDFLFSDNNAALYLVLLVVLGFFLRVIAAINLEPLADDMHFAPGAINFLSSGKIIYWDQSSGLWFAVTDIFYKILGVTQLASRFSAVLFGTMLILVMFLFVKETFKDNKLALIAAFLVAISPFHVKSMMAEMDVMAMFFVLLSAFLFIKALNKNGDKKFIILSAISIGLAIYTKVYPLLFIPGMIIFWFYKNHKDRIQIKTDFYKTLFLFLAIIFIFCLPALTHNYLLYKEKGILDHQFTRFFGLGNKEMYSWMAGGDAKSDFIGFFFGRQGQYNGWPTSLLMLYSVFNADPVIFIFGILGITLLRKRKDLLLFLGLLFVIPFFYLASIMFLIKHYLFVSIILTIPAAFSIRRISEVINYKTNFLKLKHFVLLILIFSLIYLGMNNCANISIYKESAVNRLINYKISSIPEDSLVIVDARIYRGQAAWIFNDRHYLEATYLNQLLSLHQNRTKIPIETYFIECVKDDCGWGTIVSQPEFNESMEFLVSQFKNISTKQATLNDFQGECFAVYKTTLEFAPESLASVDSTHIWWLYPLGYDKKISQIFDEYTPKTFLDALLNNLSLAILYLSILFAFLSIAFVIYFVFKELS